MKQAPSRFEIWRMFDSISTTYDLANRAMTFGLDPLWRKKLINHLPKQDALRILDCATGTGDQAISLLESRHNVEALVGIDLSEEMLKVAREKVKDKPYSSRLIFQHADVLELPFDTHSFDCVTISFGIRNVVDVKAALCEMFRVLKPTGRLLILEGTMPKNRWFKPFFLFYLRQLLPRIGGAISKNPNAYRYLNETIETFPCGKEFCTLMEDAGFVQVFAHPITFGTVTLYQGDKREHP